MPSSRTYLYKLTSDRGGAPCAPAPRGVASPLLTLSICKPAIRRTAQIGDRLLGISSHSLAVTDGYPLHAVIYAAIVTGAVEARDYYAPRSRFRSRPDCIYEFHRLNGTLAHTGRTRLHADQAYEARDIGTYPFYRNGRTLLSEEFRYFGAAAIEISPQLAQLRRVSEALGQGHRVFTSRDPEQSELDVLFRRLWTLPTRHTPRTVEDEAYGHTPRPKAGAEAAQKGRQLLRGGLSLRSRLPLTQRSGDARFGSC